jgi:sigma-B regulation protein RsbU (phosphoserine phosphatase)
VVEVPGLRRRLRLVAGVVVVVVLAAVGVAIAAAVQVRSASNDRIHRLAPASSRVSNLLTDSIDEETGVRGYLITRDQDFLAPYTSGATAVPADLTGLRSLLHGDGYGATIDAIANAHQAWTTDAAAPELAAVAAGRMDAAREVETSGVGKARFDTLRRSIIVIQARLYTDLTADAERINAAETQLLVTLSLLAALPLALMGLVGWAVRAWLLAPVASLRGAVRRVEAGRYDNPIPTPGPAEMAELGASIETMRSRLVASLGETERTLQALAQQGAAVVALRDALAPSMLRAAGLQLYGRLDPAEGVLAGDWFDTIDLPLGRVGVILGDVSGHGPAAGVHALRLKQLLTAALTGGREPGRAIEWVVDQLGDTDELFATAVVAVIDAATGTVRYASAGHTDVLLIHRGDPDPDPAASAAAADNPDIANAADVERLGTTGPLVSLIVAAPGAWETQTARLRTGDVLVAYTDGLVEARDAGGREFGSDKIADELGRDRGRDPRRLLDDLFVAVTRHAPGQPSDDRTAIALLRDANAAVTIAVHTDAIPSHRADGDRLEPDRLDLDGDRAEQAGAPPVGPAAPWQRRRRRRTTSRITTRAAHPTAPRP